MKTRNKFLASFGIFFLYVITHQAFACECMETSLEQRIENAKVIFSGSFKDNPWDYSEHHIAANFTVDTVWKGASEYPLIETGNVVVVTGVDDGICGTKFVQNTKYLIYAQIDVDVLKTSECSGSGFLNGRGDEVRTLYIVSSTHKFLDANNESLARDETLGEAENTFGWFVLAMSLFIVFAYIVMKIKRRGK